MGRTGQTSRTNAMDLRERSFTSFVGELGFILQKRSGITRSPTLWISLFSIGRLLSEVLIDGAPILYCWDNAHLNHLIAEVYQVLVASL